MLLCLEIECHFAEFCERPICLFTRIPYEVPKRQKLKCISRELISAEQDWHCLLCDFPLKLSGHLHHVVPRDLGVPDHFLNIVALCPNHHAAVEMIRHYIALSDHRADDLTHS